MQKPDDILEDIWEAAGELIPPTIRFMREINVAVHALQINVAYAILAERERCEAEWVTKIMHAEAKAILSERERCHREFRQQAVSGLVHSPRAFAFRSEAPSLTPTPPIERNEMREKLVDQLQKAIFDAMDATDGLDGTAATTYAEAAASVSKEWAVRLVLSYEPLVGSVVFDLGRALNEDVTYDEVPE
mgnify:CR=1 FL=1